MKRHTHAQHRPQPSRALSSRPRPSEAPQQAVDSGDISTRPNSKKAPLWVRASVIGTAVLAFALGTRDIGVAGYNTSRAALGEVGSWIVDTQGGDVELFDRTTKEGRAQIREAEKKGDLVRVKIDESHPDLFSIANEVNGSVKVEEIRNELEEQNGGSLVQDGDPVFVPSTESAINLHNQQFPEQQIQPPAENR